VRQENNAEREIRQLALESVFIRLVVLGCAQPVDQGRAEPRGRTMGEHERSRQESKRLTILVTSTQRRGAEVFGERLADGLPARGWTVDFVALGSDPHSQSTVTAEPLSPVPVGRFELSIVRQLRRRLIASQPDVVLANGSSTLHYGVAAARSLRGRPRLAYSSIGEPRYWAPSLRKRLPYRAFVSGVDRVFSVSRLTAAQLTESFGVPEDRIRVLATGVPPELYSDQHESHDPPLRILFLGSLSAEKQPLAAVSVLEELLATTPAVLRLVGAGPQQHALTHRGDPLEHALQLVGSVADIRPHLAWADVLLLTSRTEGLPAATMEAAAASVPSVAFDVGGVSETIDDGGSGTLVKAGDCAGAARALRSFADDPERRRAAGEAAYALANSRFTLSDAIDRYDLALRELAEEGV